MTNALKLSLWWRIRWRLFMHFGIKWFDWSKVDSETQLRLLNYSDRLLAPFNPSWRRSKPTAPPLPPPAPNSTP